MKIIVFGATGATGRLIVEQALAVGHEVVAFVRNPAKLTQNHPKLTVVPGDVLDAKQVENAIAGQDAVVSALGPTRPYVARLLENAAKNITIAMQKQGVRRLVFASGTVVRDPLDRPNLIDKLIKRLMVTTGGEILRDVERCNNLIRATDLDWTLVRYPLILTDGERSGQYRVGYLGKASRKLSRADGADFVVQELSNPRFIRQAPVVSY